MLVLLVEDDPDARFIYASCLRHAGFEVVTASNGADKLTQGKLKEQYAESFPQAAIDNIKWYPAVPAGLEEIEGKILDRVKAGS